MKIAMGCDHAAVEYKNEIRDLLRSQGHEVTDVGIEAGEKADYPDIAEKVGGLVAGGTVEKGILICGTGIAGADRNGCYVAGRGRKRQCRALDGSGFYGL